MQAVVATRKTRTSPHNGTDTTVTTSCAFTVDLITAVGWLDVLDVSVHCISSSGVAASGGGEIEGEGERGVVVSLSLASTGFLPLVIPGASLCNVFLCWVPFLSVEQSQRLSFFRDKLGAVHAIDTEEKTCNL